RLFTATRVVIGVVLFLATCSALMAETPIPAEVLVEVPGTIILSGGGKVGESARRRFVEEAGSEKAKLVILFAGSEKEEKRLTESWGEYKTTALHVLAIGERKQADDADLAKKIAGATGVWIEAGDASKLAANLVGTAAERELHKLLKHGGILGSESSSA